jgi:cystathionine beta-lyase/cystathionine gamma-synthase
MSKQSFQYPNSHSIHSSQLALDSVPVQAPTSYGNHNSLCTPLVQSTTFVRSEIGGGEGFAYSRVSNPTVDSLERQLGRLEDSPPAVCCSSGLAAEQVLFLSVLKAGDHVICGQAVYGGTTRLLQQVLSGLGIETTFVDCSRVSEVEQAFQANTRLVFLESPANPTLQLTDVATIVGIAHPRGILVAVDNTFLTPLGQRPLDLGADIAVYSTTKLIEGHSTALGGSLVARDTNLLERFRFIRKSIGCIQTPGNAWQTLQGLKTLAIRLRVQFENAARVARWLETRSEIASVFYPGLEATPQRELAERQHRLGHGNVVTFELAGGYTATLAFVRRLKLCRLVEHVGSVETLITHSASMTHADVPDELRRAAGISDGLLRLSVGIEDWQDVVDDLFQAWQVDNVIGRRCDVNGVGVANREEQPCLAGR